MKINTLKRDLYLATVQENNTIYQIIVYAQDDENYSRIHITPSVIYNCNCIKQLSDPPTDLEINFHDVVQKAISYYIKNTITTQRESYIIETKEPNDTYYLTIDYCNSEKRAILIGKENNREPATKILDEKDDDIQYLFNQLYEQWNNSPIYKK